MKSPSFRAALVVLALALFASACGSDSPTSEPPATEAGTESGAGEGTGSETSSGDEGSTTGSNVGTADPTDSDSAGTGEIVDQDPGTVVTQMTQELFNIDPSPQAVDCILDQSERLPHLAQAIADKSVVFTQLGDDKLRAVSFGMNGCLDPISLGEWTTAAVGPSSEVAETAPACFAEAFGDPDQGDHLFHTFVAVSFQYRYEPEHVPAMVDTFVSCTPVTSLATLFASQTEADSNFATTVDRDCLDSALSDTAVSTAFWSMLIDGEEQPVSVITPHVDACASERETSIENFEPWSGTGALADIAPAARQNAYTAQPPISIDPAASYQAVFATGGGEIVIQLFAETAPVTVNNFVSLARDGYFDGTVFHRVLDDFMAQAGDPTGTGTGGPGYSFQDETSNGPPLDRAGLLAMANSGPNTNGSQFFITFVATDWLTGNHTVFGEVIEGQNIVDAIERRDPTDGQSNGQLIETITIIES